MISHDKLKNLYIRFRKDLWPLYLTGCWLQGEASAWKCLNCQLLLVDFKIVFWLSFWKKLWKLSTEFVFLIVFPIRFSPTSTEFLSRKSTFSKYPTKHLLVQKKQQWKHICDICSKWATKSVERRQLRHSGVFNTDVKQMQYVLNSSKTTTSLRLQMSYGIKYLKTNSIMIFLIRPSGWKDLLLKHGCFRRLFLLRYTYVYLFNAISDDQWKLD